jgi:hypothetical protein
MVARREWTREWWSRAMTVQTDLVTSLAVIDELERGDFDARSDCLGLISGLPVLAIVQCGRAAGFRLCDAVAGW